MLALSSLLKSWPITFASARQSGVDLHPRMVKPDPASFTLVRARQDPIARSRSLEVTVRVEALGWDREGEIDRSSGHDRRRQ